MLVLVIISVLLPLSAAYVNCKVACQQCGQRDGTDPQVEEVYCAMCQECKERRRERLKSSQALDSLRNQTEALKRNPPGGPEDHRNVKSHKSKHKIVKLASDGQRPHEEASQEEEDCPTPPPCEESSSVEYVKVKLKGTVTQPTTTTSTRKPCPTINTCRKKKKATQHNCMPCMPMCMMPCVHQTAPTATTEATTHTTTDYYYVYVGVPKNLIKHD